MKKSQFSPASQGSFSSSGGERVITRPRPVSVEDRRAAAQEIKIGERLAADVDLSQVRQADMESVERALEAISSLSTRMPKLAFRVVRSSDETYYIITASGLNVTINGPGAYRALSSEHNRFLSVYDWEWNAGTGVLTVLSATQNVVVPPGVGAPFAGQFDGGVRQVEGSRRKRGRIIEGDNDPDFA